jgi:hypothetical protein
MSEWLDDGGYPTDAALDRIEQWSYADLDGLFAFMKELWWMADWGWHEEIVTDGKGKEKVFKIYTGGWSGNESIISAMQSNRMVWVLTWHSSHRGGHYEFRIPVDRNKQG